MNRRTHYHLLLRPIACILGLSLCVLGSSRSSRADAIESNPVAAAAGSQLQSLDGSWEIAQDLRDMGKENKWFDPVFFPVAASRQILVPGTISEVWPNSGHIFNASNLAWYRRTFTLEGASAPGVRRYLRFGAVRYSSEFWMNGVDLGSHEGGDDPFEFDVTKLLLAGQTNTVIVRISAPNFGGITQHVSLVAQPDVRLIDGFARPNVQKGVISLEVTLENNTSAPAVVSVTAALDEFKMRHTVGSQVISVIVPPGRMTTSLVLNVPQAHLWSLDDPFLYRVGIATLWQGAPTEAAGRDGYEFRTGFRDFRITDGYFYLNGKRIFLKCAHSNWYDPITILATPRNMKYVSQDFPQLKKAGFNAFRFIVSAALPEQLDQADEMGFMLYSEHETSWPSIALNDATKFGISLDQIVRRDRNHPSVVMWGLLNETSSVDAYERAKAWLPRLRAIDDTRLVMLSSGRWDEDFKTGSASNPGSTTWNVYMGGEDPVQPVSTGHFSKELEVGAFFSGTGDAHIYNRYPTPWKFVTEFAALAQNTKPFFLSEAGMSSLYNPIHEEQKLKEVGAPPDAYAWNWINVFVSGLKKTWTTYGLYDVYPSIEDMCTDSELSESRQRELIFNMVRSNPKIIGYNLTSVLDAWGAGEGVMDTFREFKAGHLAVLQAGWAPLRWCLFVNPMNAYADRPLHVKVALANEDRLPPGEYPATLKISGAQGAVWTSRATVRVEDGRDAPLAYTLFDRDITVPGLSAGTYTLEATLEGSANAAANTLAFTVTSRGSFPDHLGSVTVLGVDQNTRDFLTRQGAQLHDYKEGERIDREVILVGNSFTGNAAAWRALYGRIAGGAHAVFLSQHVFGYDKAVGWVPIRWLAVNKTTDLSNGKHGVVNVKELTSENWSDAHEWLYDNLNNQIEWLYHKELVAKNVPAFAGLQSKLMTPDYYGDLLQNAAYFDGVAVPDETAAVAIRLDYWGWTYMDGVVLGTYKHHAGHFTINGLDILGNLGNPAADHLLLNLVVGAKSDAVPLQPLPAGYDVEMDALGIRDRL